MSHAYPRRFGAACFAAILVASSLAGCGRKGPLESPPGAPQTQTPAAAEAQQTRVFGDDENSTATGLIQSPNRVTEVSAAAKLNSATKGTAPPQINRASNAQPASKSPISLLDPLLN